MTTDIDRLTEAELIDLNHRIVERLRFLQQMRAHKQIPHITQSTRHCRRFLFALCSLHDPGSATCA